MLRKTNAGDIPLNIGASIRLEMYGNRLYKITKRKGDYIWFEALDPPTLSGGTADFDINYTSPHRCILLEEWFRDFLYNKSIRKAKLEKIIEENEEET